MTKSGVLDLGPDTRASVGDVISYTITVENTGNVTVENTVVPDPDADAGSIEYAAADDTDADLDIDSLAPGDTATVTATHMLTQADIDAGSFTNTATANGTTTEGTGVEGEGSETTTIPRESSLSVTKTPSTLGPVAEGEEITYTYVVTNTGNTVLTAVTLSDTHTSGSGPSLLSIVGDVLTMDAGAIGDSSDAAADGIWDSLAPSDGVSFTATYTVTQADIDAAADLTNTVDVTSTIAGWHKPNR